MIHKIIILFLLFIVTSSFGQTKKIGDFSAGDKKLKDVEKIIGLKSGNIIVKYFKNLVYFSSDGSVKWKAEVEYQCQKLISSEDGSAIYVFNYYMRKRDKDLLFLRYNSVGGKTEIDVSNVFQNQEKGTHVIEVFCTDNSIYILTASDSWGLYTDKKGIKKGIKVKLYACSHNEEEFSLIKDFGDVGSAKGIAYFGQTNNKVYIYTSSSGFLKGELSTTVWEVDEKLKKVKEFSFDFAIQNRNVKKKEHFRSVDVIRNSNEDEYLSRSYFTAYNSAYYVSINKAVFSINSDKNEINITGFTVGNDTYHRAIQGFHIVYSLESKAIKSQDFKPVIGKGLNASSIAENTRMMQSKNGVVIYNREESAVINVEKGRLKEVKVVKIKVKTPYEVEIYGTGNYPEFRKYLQANGKSVLDFAYFENINKFVVLLKGGIIQLFEY